MPDPIEVLLVEDNAADARLLVESLKDAGPSAFRVTSVSRLSAAQAQLARSHPDVILLDLSLPDSSGLATVERMKAAAPGVPIVVLTGLEDEALALQAVRLGVQDYLVKGQCEGGLAARSVRYAVERRRAEEATRSAERQLRTITDAVPALISLVDRDGYYRLNNHAYETWFGVSRAAVVGRHMKDVLGDAAWDKLRPNVERCLAGEEVRYEDRLPYNGGGARWVSGSYTPYRGPAGEVEGIVVLVTDISDRKRAEDAVRESEARLRAVVETAVDAIITIDERGRIDSANPATERMFGYGRDEMVGQDVGMLMPEPYRSEHDQYVDRYLRTSETRIIGVGREVVGLRSDGTTFPLDLSVSEFRLGDRRMFTGILHDITNRRRLEREILEASTNEQRRVGHELHDGLCQQLTGISFSAEILARKLEAKAPDAVPLVRKLADEVDQAITQTRKLARGLNPVEVLANSLAPALEDLAQKVSESFGLTCRFVQQGNGDAAVPDSTAATHLFRIAQEAISNAVRHGGAKTVELKMQSDDRSLALSIADDGKGFSPEEREIGARPAAGIGLQTMSYRAKMINGILDVRPRAGRGVVVTCSIPRANRPPSR
jgi:two-component system CheB/CheR fusion protein